MKNNGEGYSILEFGQYTFYEVINIRYVRRPQSAIHSTQTCYESPLKACGDDTLFNFFRVLHVSIDLDKFKHFPSFFCVCTCVLYASVFAARGPSDIDLGVSARWPWTQVAFQLSKASSNIASRCPKMGPRWSQVTLKPSKPRPDMSTRPQKSLQNLCKINKIAKLILGNYQLRRGKFLETLTKPVQNPQNCEKNF